MHEMPAGEFAGWRAAYEFEPWGDERADLSRAVGHAINDAILQKGRSKPRKEYMPFFHEPEEKHPAPGDPTLGRQIWNAMASMWNKARERRKAATTPRKR
jgi:hypothetical protein